MIGEQSTRTPGGSTRTEYVLLGVVLAVYGLLALLNPGRATAALAKSASIVVRITPVLVVVWVAIALSQYLLAREAILEAVQSSHGLTGYVVAIVTGTLSHGPVYAWYALLGDLRDRGLTDGLIAVFLYNRAIKLPLIPVFLAYFDWQFALVLFGTMVVASIVQGVVIDLLMADTAT